MMHNGCLPNVYISISLSFDQGRGSDVVVKLLACEAMGFKVQVRVSPPQFLRLGISNIKCSSIPSRGVLGMDKVKACYKIVKSYFAHECLH